VWIGLDRGDGAPRPRETLAGHAHNPPLTHKHTPKSSLMKSAVEHYTHELAGVRTGRANPGLIENLQVAVEGGGGGGGSGGGGSGSHHSHHPHGHVPLRALGTVTVRDPQTLAVSVFDPSMAGAVARAIQNSPLGLAAAPAGSGDGGGGNSCGGGGEVLVRLPRMTREVVERMVKLVHAEGEEALVSIRRARQRALEAAKRAYGSAGSGGSSKSGKSSEQQRAEKAVQTLVDKYTAEVERMKKLKDKELRQQRD
jgi:ribosome recycling factor